jgi:hypothetical protein
MRLENGFNRREHKDLKGPKKRNVDSMCSLRSLRLKSFPILFIFVVISASAQIQQAWVARYNNGITNGTHQAVKMALDSVGNIYVTGFSQNTNSQLGYVTIKYAPNGNQLWAARFDSNGYPSATPSGLVLDYGNNTIVTGNALTVKYDANGNQVWTAPYSGTSLNVDAGANIYVAGFGTNFNAVKLSSAGSNVWFAQYVDVGPTLAQAILVDTQTNIYLAGSDTYQYYGEGPDESSPNSCLTVGKFDLSGHLLWTAPYRLGGDEEFGNVAGAALDNADNFYVSANATGYPFQTTMFSNNGSELWNAGQIYGGARAYGLTLDSSGRAIVIGEACPTPSSYPNMSYGTMKLDTNGHSLWAEYYPQSPLSVSVGTAITIDAANNVYVTGYSPGTNSNKDIATVKYDQNGNQIWLQRYQSLGAGNAAGNAIAVDNNGNVYVTGYDTTTAGGTEIVTIKYSAVTIQHQSNGTILLQAQGAPGESFDVQASTDLQTWLDIGSAIADTNGLAQFDDTNAPNFDWRFYTTQPQ